MEEMVINLMERLIETTTRAVEAETYNKLLREELAELNKKYKELEDDHKTTEGAYAYQCKHNAELEAKVKVYEAKEKEDNSYHSCNEPYNGGPKHENN